jgi:hypothetical protein
MMRKLFALRIFFLRGCCYVDWILRGENTWHFPNKKGQTLGASWIFKPFSLSTWKLVYGRLKSWDDSLQMLCWLIGFTLATYVSTWLGTGATSGYPVCDRQLCWCHSWTRVTLKELTALALG